jgi:hypothetical protein
MNIERFVTIDDRAYDGIRALEQAPQTQRVKSATKLP